MLGPNDYHPVPVADAWDETPSLRAVRLQLPPALAAAHALPGQVVKVRAGPGEGFFALASAPDAGGRAELLVKRGGAVADAAIAAARTGADLPITAPFGRGFPVESALGHDVLLFAAGSGIAPIRALLQALLRRRDEVDRIVLFYGQRNGADFAYRGEHLSWERRGVRVVLCPSAADDAWEGVRGRVGAVARTLDFGGARLGKAATFVSGMSAMVADVKEALASAGAPPGRVHLNF
ncbi:MAG: oxidoreductase [Anaeromyxobacteraceae bacterium]|nr:oxidoreductase [Anaeromyxobacteraceae bacterium]